MHGVFFLLFIAQVLVGLVLVKFGVFMMPYVEGFGVLLIVSGGWLIITAIQCYRSLTKEEHDADM